MTQHHINEVAWKLDCSQIMHFVPTVVHSGYSGQSFSMSAVGEIIELDSCQSQWCAIQSQYEENRPQF